MYRSSQFANEAFEFRIVSEVDEPLSSDKYGHNCGVVVPEQWDDRVSVRIGHDLWLHKHMFISNSTARSFLAFRDIVRSADHEYSVANRDTFHKARKVAA
ncbi:MAG: hypothetical protein VR70_10460 [Rhodospirillaceae bacterium BRH_c57]|nr:MAG: hypothetical protein VR70_10460 [Rhodospirillaceae bacterium BRH_c57]